MSITDPVWTWIVRPRSATGTNGTLVTAHLHDIVEFFSDRGEPCPIFGKAHSIQAAYSVREITNTEGTDLGYVIRCDETWLMRALTDDEGNVVTLLEIAEDNEDYETADVACRALTTGKTEWGGGGAVASYSYKVKE